jgi:hypothetical protein
MPTRPGRLPTLAGHCITTTTGQQNPRLSLQEAALEQRHAGAHRQKAHQLIMMMVMVTKKA